MTFLRFLRIIILVRVFRLAAQRKELEKVTRRMVRSPPWKRRTLLIANAAMFTGVFWRMASLYNQCWHQERRCLLLPDQWLGISLRFRRISGVIRRMGLTLILPMSQVAFTCWIKETHHTCTPKNTWLILTPFKKLNIYLHLYPPL